MTLHLRSKGDPVAMLPAIRNEVDALGQNVTLSDVRTLSDFISESLLSLRVVSTLTGVFGVLAAVLALVGVFSLINYSTSRRTREIGIRLALGALRVDILRMILKEALFVVTVGAVAGLVMAYASGKLIASMLFGGSTASVSVYIVVTLMLITVAMLASSIPAYKATRIDPNDALRHE